MESDNRDSRESWDADIEIINCLPHDIFLATPAGLVKLPRTSSPALLYRPAEIGSITVKVPGEERIKVSLDSHDGIIVFGSADVPPVQDNTLYLVSLAVLEQFPDREDFVIANTWPVPEAPEDGQIVVHVLVGVSRSPFEVVGVKGLDDIPDFLLPEDEENDDEPE